MFQINTFWPRKYY